ncbi:MAG: RNA-guided endonuclease InsQ/TnpB family protein [Promethearchaeota archaeon]
MTIISSIHSNDVQDTIEIMHLVERIQVKTSPDFSKICYKSKNLYNKANYVLRHYFFLIRESHALVEEWLKKVTNYLISSPREFDKVCRISEKYLKKIDKRLEKKPEKSDWSWFFNSKLRISYTRLEKLMKLSPEYMEMPAQSAQQVLMKLVTNWESYCKSTIEYYESKKQLPPKEFKKKYSNKPSIPSYKKKNGEITAYFTNQQAKISDGYLVFPGHTRNPRSPRWLPPIKTRFRGKFSLVEIVPQGGVYIIGIVYKKEKEYFELDPDRVKSMDLGVRNIITMVDNIGSRPIIIKGGVVKSINQYFNKRRSKLVSAKDKQKYKHWTRRLMKLSLIRYNKLNNIFHILSKNVIQHCIHNNIGTIVIGYNIGWKQNSNMGKRNNQNFVSIPFLSLINKVKYKAELIGIKVILEEENYTSQCSFLDGEEICWHSTYKGKRVKGLFYTAKGHVINADVNAAYNIMKKALPEAISENGIEDAVMHPRCLKWF